jgi:CHAT domain-containing protein/Tfp pilus assembly protein PilF
MLRQWQAAVLAGVVVLAAPAELPAQDAEGRAEVDALGRRADALKKAGKLSEAIKVARRRVALARERFGATHLDIATPMNDLATLYQDLGQYAKAEPLFRRSLEIGEAKLGKDHPHVATFLNNLALLCYQLGQYAKAEPLYKRSLKIREATLGKDHPDVAGSLHNLAELYRVTGAYAKAELLYRRSLEIMEAKLGKDHPLVARSLQNLAMVYRDMGQYAKAEPLSRRCLEILEAKLDKDHPDLSSPLCNLALLYQDMGQYAKAEPLCLRSLKIMEANLGKDHPNVATSLNNLAMVYTAMGQHAKAELLYLRSLEIYEAKLGKDHPFVAASLNNLAVLYRDMGQYAKAEPLFRRGLKIREAKLGKDHPDVATSLDDLAELDRRSGQYAKAEPLFRRSLEIREANLGKDHPNVATSLNNLALLYKDMGQYAKAEPLCLRSLEILEAKLDKDHPGVATSLNNLATLYQDMGQDARAEPLYRRSLEIYEAKLGKDHPSLATSLNNLALLCAAREDAAEAVRLLDRARRSARRYIASVLPALPDADKAAFFTNTGARGDLEAALSLALDHKNDTDLVALSATWLLNGKGIDQEGLALSVLLARSSGDQAVSKLTARLLAVRQQLARLTLSAARAGQEKQRLQQIQELTAQEQDLGKQLRHAGSTAAPPTWVDLSDLKNALPDKSVLIDVARIRARNFKARTKAERWKPARYVAWVVSRGAAQIVDLGDADKIDEAVQQFRAAMKDAGKRILAKGEEKAEKVLGEHLAALAKRVLAPLLPHIATSKTWLISPDGNLWLVPFEALPVGEGSYAVEKHQISYLTSGRDLLPAVAAKVRVRGPLVLADPDFDLSPEAARAEAKRLLGERVEESTPSASGSFRLGKVLRLAGTAAEAKAIAPSLKAYTGVAPRVLTGPSALEGVFRRLRNPRVLVVSTHGFFLPDQEVSREEKGKAKAAKKWENPLLRCGLLLAGCNNAARMTGDDGVLTGLEVLGADLRGTELVVLSACDTGLGEVQSGEGVAGLRQAFQLAGARAVVSTLWQVPDQQSARLMALFFHNLAKGMSKAEALRAAKVQVIKERREDAAAAHPFFWAAFTLTGQP